MLPFLVTGVGHSGTGWAARLFCTLGITCGHERWFSPSRQHLGGPDSSWLAVPHLEQLPAGTPVVHLVRDPLKVAQSYARQDNEHDWSHSPYYRYARRHRPDIFEPDTMIGRVLARVAGWDRPLMDLETVDGSAGVLRVRVEDATADPRVAQDLVEFATGRRPNLPVLAAALERIGTGTNRHLPNHRDVLTAADVRGTPVEARALALGYGSY